MKSLYVAGDSPQENSDLEIWDSPLEVELGRKDLRWYGISPLGREGGVWKHLDGGCDGLRRGY